MVGIYLAESHINTKKKTFKVVQVFTFKLGVGKVKSLKIAFYRKCGPRLSQEAAEKLKNRYVLMRNSAGEYERETGKKVSIPITVRYVYISKTNNLYPTLTDGCGGKSFCLFSVCLWPATEQFCCILLVLANLNKLF